MKCLNDDSTCLTPAIITGLLGKNTKGNSCYYYIEASKKLSKEKSMTIAIYT